jgi:hypothetical protein
VGDSVGGIREAGGAAHWLVSIGLARKGSTYEVLEHLYGGQNDNFQHAKKAGKLGPITGYPGYRLMREKEEAGGMGSLVDLVKSFEQLGRDKKDEGPDAELGKVDEELRRIPRFDDLCQRIRERRTK